MLGELGGGGDGIGVGWSACGFAFAEVWRMALHEYIKRVDSHFGWVNRISDALLAAFQCILYTIM